jgi:hypothetical protein
LAVADCTALVAACAFAGPELPAGPVAAPLRAVMARLAAGEALALLCGAALSAGAGAVEELPGAAAFVAVLVDTFVFAAAASADVLLTVAAGCAAGWVAGSADCSDCESWLPVRVWLTRARVCSPIARLVADAVVVAGVSARAAGTTTAAATGAAADA